MNNNPYLLSFSRISSVSASKVRRLKKYFGSLESAWKCSDTSEFLRAGVKQEWIELFFKERRTIDIEDEMQRLEKSNVQLVSRDDEEYPLYLREIHDAPEWLYVAGVIPNRPLIAVVGTRQMSDYMKRATTDIVQALVSANVCVVSGLAFGVDAEAHRTATLQNGTTIAVLGSGLNLITPRQHTKLAGHIVATGGAVLTEYPFDKLPEPHHFPQRNRIISGLSRAAIVIGAGEKSGALITARLAMEQNRDVYAVPGTIYAEGSKGCHKLIRQGAGLIDSTEHLLEDLGITSATQPRLIPHLNEREQKIFAYLTREPIHFDEIARAGACDPATLAAVLSVLEMHGLVESLPGMRYARSRL